MNSHVSFATCDSCYELQLMFGKLCTIDKAVACCQDPLVFSQPPVSLGRRPNFSS